jgi:phosphoserine phosphatase
MSEIILINVSGQDKPGLTQALMQTLSEYDAGILDIGQAVIHDTLSLGMLVAVPEGNRVSGLLKDVLYHCHQLELQVRFTPVPDEEYSLWAEGTGKSRYIITLLGRIVSAAQIARIASVISENGLNIVDIQRLSRRSQLVTTDTQSRACIQLSLSGIPDDLTGMKNRFMTITTELGIDIGFQEDNIFRRNRRLVVFDMDSTLIQQEVIDELAKEVGAEKEVSLVTEAAMRGELDFKESLRQRVKLLKGMPEGRLEVVAERLKLTEGTRRLIGGLKSFGFKTAIISGGFNYFGKKLKEELGMDYLYANTLEIANGVLTGKVTGKIVDGVRKAELLATIAGKEGIQLEQVIAVGDGANDLPMLNIAGLGIAFHAKPIVKENAGHSISTLGLDGILYLIGMKDTDIST